jgi:hypothetical protein
MSSGNHRSAAVNRRRFLQHSLSAASLAAVPGVARLSASNQPTPAPAAPQGGHCQRLDHDFATLTLSGDREFGTDEAPEGRITLVVHFFGLIAFVKKDRFILADPMRVLLPKTPDAGKDHHDARLWALESVSSGNGSTTLGRFKFWDLYSGGGTRIDLEEPEGCLKKEGDRRNHPWEDFKFVSNLKKLFPQGEFYDDYDLRLGANNNVVTYFGLPRGKLISGVPWSFLGTNAIWKYTNAEALRPRTLTDNVSYFRTLPKGQQEVKLQLHGINGAQRPPVTVTISPRTGERIITCAITHAMPPVCADNKALAGHTEEHRQTDTNTHSAMYYQLFKNPEQSNKPVPTFARGVRGERQFSRLVELGAPLARFNRMTAPDDQRQPSTDEGHCECASWF